jgi:hypothetical protein
MHRECIYSVEYQDQGGKEVIALQSTPPNCLETHSKSGQDDTRAYDIEGPHLDKELLMSVQNRSNDSK